NYDYNRAVSLVRSNFDNKLLDNLYRDEYLISGYYRTWLITGEWLDYLISLDFKKNSMLQSQKDYKFRKISNTYTGKIREFAFYDRLKRAIELCKTLEALNDCINNYEIYGSALKNIYYSKSLATKLEEKKMDLLRTQAGEPAPSFVLESSQGIKYSLEAFKGKVVYLDLWASWCSPCREEMPILKALYDQYKNDDRIAFVSIAVHDEEGKWRKAISEDKPDWIQLFDKEGVVAKSYFVNLIPQFVLIDKKGKIVKFNAPWPSNGKELQSLLSQEIAK
ncbi:MAG TPA: TlpA disulfide reductase family protein, partial [Flavisolibacter sp.]|nr:TlpA disulfide reductase family protein [Flavisolibacter sp.]